ncbi:RDD family protein [Desulfosarcina sp. OttesenSCG-928-G10]|nr:RDD family protein [Desulfosarcina sp. OttesenSCG-928-G10]
MIRTDRVGALVEGNTRKRKILLTPEGVPLDIQIADHGERLAALVIDIVFMYAAIIISVLLIVSLFFANINLPIGATLMLFAGFVVRNLYFLHFELAWQGRTPGKRICGLRVINRQGGELKPSAVIARNLTREVEFFLPLSILFSSAAGQGGWVRLAMLGWVLAISLLPFFNKGHLRAGDLIGGTQVIAMPKRVLLGDLSALPPKKARRGYTFSPGQLAIYGAFELQVLEEFLRRPETKTSEAALQDVCTRICKKIGWETPIPKEDIRGFLTDFYKAERADLERGQLFGRIKADKGEGENSGSENRK